MPEPSNNALDRYIGLADDVVSGRVKLDEWVAVFAPDAVVEIFPGQVVRGAEQVREFYRQFAASFAETRHMWNGAVLPDGTLHATWAAVLRMADGSVSAVSGVERAKVDAEGLITDLRNEFTVLPAPPT
jgi:SnoaL-like domain